MLTLRPTLLATFLGAVVLARTIHAQAPLGQVVGSFPFSASRLLADPERPRVYATVPATNSVAVIDTHSLQIVANVFVGPNPVDMSLSPDGNTLYTANRDSTSAAVGVLDLNTFQTRPSLALPGIGYAVAAGLDGRLYVSTFNSLYQVDAATGAMQGTLDTGYDSAGYLKISPDRQTLYSAYAEVSSYDVSTPTATLLQAHSGPIDRGGNSLTLSHDGRLICLPNDESDNATLLFTANLDTFPGILELGDPPGPLAFSPDDSAIYAAPQFADEGFLRIYSTSTFLETAHVQVPVPNSTPSSQHQVLDLATDSTGSFLFISQNNSPAGGVIVVVATGAGTLVAPDPMLPIVSIQNDTPEIYNHLFEHGHFTLTRTGDVSQPLTVYYSIGGTALDGVDFNGLSGKKTFKAGKAQAGIDVVPTFYYNEDRGGTVKLRVTANPFYNLGAAKAKVIIIP